MNLGDRANREMDYCREISRPAAGGCLYFNSKAGLVN